MKRRRHDVHSTLLRYQHAVRVVARITKNVELQKDLNDLLRVLKIASDRAYMRKVNNWRKAKS